MKNPQTGSFHNGGDGNKAIASHQSLNIITKHYKNTDPGPLVPLVNAKVRIWFNLIDDNPFDPDWVHLNE